MDLKQKIKDFQLIPAIKFRNHRHYLWEDFLRKYNCDTICEIGIRNGENFELITRHNPKEAVAIDCWIDNGVLSRNDRCYTQEELDNQYNEVKKLIKDKPFARIIRDYSFNAVKQFPDEYFDFIYIDADHSFEGCYRDIVDWYPKVKKNGILCGDDYNKRHHVTKNGSLDFGVVEAVRKYSKENNLEYFLLRPITWAVIKI